MKAKIQSLLQQLNQGLVEREHVLKLAMLTTLAGENLVLVGPPGTGKSLVARRIAQSLSHEGEDGAGYFEYLLTKFSTPEELFGPLSITALKADRFHRNTAGYLPTVRMAFLDEIFKASSSILNALLTVLNERVYHNGTEVQKVPLQALIAASNELPTDQEELAALYDRFLVRVFVDYVGANNLSRLFETTTEPTLRAQDMLSAADLARVRQAADQVVFEPALIQAVQDIWAAHKEAFKEDRRESLSDRRLKKVIHLMRVSAATNGREAVDLSDVMLLKDCLWNHADNVKKVQEVVLKTLQRHSRQVPATALLLSGKSQAPAYELGSDGRTLVPARTSSALAVKATVSGGATGRMNAVVKGYAGSGTEEDPLLIQTVDDLVDLARPEVGQKGYHFRQTADLDIGSISTWPAIKFHGNYDGQSFELSDGTKKLLRIIFTEVENSCIAHLNSSGVVLAHAAKNNCRLIDCFTEYYFFTNANDCEIIDCGAFLNIIYETAVNCKINFCYAGLSIAKNVLQCEIKTSTSTGPLVSDCAKYAEIEDCAVSLDIVKIGGATGGIASELVYSSVKRCFVSGEIKEQYRFGGIACSASIGCTIENCSIGPLRGRFSANFFRICCDTGNSAFKNNIAIDSIKVKGGNTKSNGESIASARFNQRFFEHTLGWDFENVWIWDKEKNQPVLRDIDSGDSESRSGAISTANTGGNTTADLLTQQVKANIWL
jgi:MoxR-like ATPase